MSRPESDAGTPAFAGVLAGDGRTPSYRRWNRLNLVLQILIVLLLLAALICVVWIPAVQYMSQRRSAMEAENAASRMAAWPQGRIKAEYAKAKAYNQRIAASGQTTLGEATDPFAPGKGGTLSQEDKAYQSLLEGPGGIMGTIRIPQVSIHLPIYHGTSEEVLQDGVGHLYGTSLPVGGASTNVVLSGHRGLTNALLFTRLDELKPGDIFYIDSLGRTMGYRIKSVHVIDPEDVHLYKVVPGKDLVTLMTCTPYGVNTQRLVLTAERQSIPEPIPDPGDAPKDGRLLGLMTGLGLLVVGTVSSVVAFRFRLPPRHRLGESAGKA